MHMESIEHSPVLESIEKSTDDETVPFQNIPCATQLAEDFNASFHVAEMPS